MNQIDIQQIAGKHLGRTSDGKTMTRYEAPEQHDASLLVPIPRSFNREKSNITSDFIGFDVWNAYEFSYLKPTKMPVTGVLKLSYNSASPFMVESKSLKLYLNSFDFESFASPDDVIKVIESDLSTALQSPVMACLHITGEPTPVFQHAFENFDDLMIKIDCFHENADLLDQGVIEFQDVNRVTYHTANLRSNCEITNQKDTGNCYVCMYTTKAPSPDSFMQYVISMRNAQHFHENITEIMYHDLMRKFQPAQLLVVNLYNRRGGIDINPVRASDHDIIQKELHNYQDVNVLHAKTLQS